jgi:hypothetical protein
MQLKARAGLFAAAALIVWTTTFTSKTSSSHLPLLFLHVGPHKTGTSYFQRQLCQNQDALAEQGYRLPVCKRCHSCTPKHFAGLALQLANRSVSEWKASSMFACAPDAVACFQEALAAAPASPAMLSSEAFDGLNATHVARLAGLLRGYDVRVVLYHRAKLPHILSYYAQRNRRGAFPTPLLEFVSDAVGGLDQRPGAAAEHSWDGADCSNLSVGQRHKPLDGLQIARVVALYSSAFGAGNVHVLSYDGIAAAGADVFQAFLETVVKIPRAALTVQPLPRENESAAALTLSIEAMLCRYAQQRLGADVARFPAGCLTPAAERLAKVLPLRCGLMRGAIASWEQAELAYLRASGARLHYFDSYDLDQPAPGARSSSSSGACDVDHVELLRDWGTWSARLKREGSLLLAACAAAA